MCGSGHANRHAERSRRWFRPVNVHFTAWHAAWTLAERMSAICAAERRILIADDQHDLLDALRLLLKNEGIPMDAVTSPEAAIDAVSRRTYDLLLMDLNYTATRLPAARESTCSRACDSTTIRCRWS